MQKQELENRLDEYKNIFKDDILKYLHSLINLEYSVVNSNICNSDRIALNDLDIYRTIARYNIYHRALNILKKYEGVQTKIIDDYTGILSTTDILDTKEDVFSLTYNYGISNITLYKKVFDEDIRLSKIKRLERDILTEEELLRNVSTLDASSHDILKDISYFRRKRINYLEEKKDQLKKLPDFYEQYDVINKINEEFMDDYGLTSRDFSNRGKSKLNKVLILERPGIKIKQDIVIE